MIKTKIKAEIVAHSLSPQGDELVSVLATFPRIILAEVNTHKMLEKNTSSSRAIPFFKMVTSIQEDCFVPIAWQKHHSGMQGNEYISAQDLINSEHFVEDYIEMVKKQAIEDKVELTKEFIEVLENMHKTLISLLSDQHWHTVEELWLKIKDITIFSATTLYVIGGVTKQLANRLLEPFMWTTMLITGPRNHGGWENFFKLRCPDYVFHDKEEYHARSRKDIITQFGKDEVVEYESGNVKLEHLSEIQWLQVNFGAAEIHMMALAEAIWDAVNESVPKQLKAGEWHIPFGHKMNLPDSMKKLEGSMDEVIKTLVHTQVKVSVAMGARTSYTIVGEEKKLNYESLLGLHDRLLNQNPPHSSPLGHAARAMSNEEHETFIKGKLTILNDGLEDNIEIEEPLFKDKGWCTNVKGFITYRYIVENKLTM